MSAHSENDSVDLEVEQADAQPGGMGRRALLQSIVGGIGAGLAVPGLVQAQTAQAPQTHDHAKVTTARKKASAAAYKPEFLDAHQFETVQALAERIVPGSTDAKVAPFIDQLLAVDTATSQRNFYAALGAFEMLAVDKYSKPWTALTAAQQDELLTTASTAQSGRAMEGPTFDPRRAGPPQGKMSIRDHFDNIKSWVSGAYYSSEPGMKELGWTGNVFFDKLPGCDHPDGHTSQ